MQSEFTALQGEIHMQSEFTALQGEIHNLKNLKHEFEQAKNFKLNNRIIKMAYLYMYIKKDLKTELLKVNRKKIIFRKQVAKHSQKFVKC